MHPKIIFWYALQNRKREHKRTFKCRKNERRQERQTESEKREIQNMNHAQDNNNRKMRCLKSVNSFFLFTSLFIYSFSRRSVLGFQPNNAVDESSVIFRLNVKWNAYTFCNLCYSVIWCYRHHKRIFMAHSQFETIKFLNEMQTPINWYSLP